MSRKKAILSSDTTFDVERRQVALWRKMSPLEKARMVAAASLTVRELSLTGIRERFPTASDRECFLRYAVLTLGRSLACEAYPEAASLSDI